MRLDFWFDVRAKAEVFPNGCRVARKTTTKPDGTQVYTAQFFYPKAEKPVWNYRFRTIAERRAKIAETIAAYDAHLAETAARRAKRSAGDFSQMDPGAVLSYSWGYDQTNVEYFQVVSRSGQTVKIAGIAAETVAGDHVRPAVGRFLKTRKVCGASGRSLKHDETAPRDADMIQYDHEYVPHIATQTKRIQFATWRTGDDAGEAFLRTPHGNANIVKVLRFGNADPLSTSSHYQTPFGSGH
jgi:hypothetical protein